MTRDKQAASLAAMLRVNHAGERAAVAISEGQAAALARTGDTALTREVATMVTQERAHLATMEALLAEHGARPSLLDPLWQAAGLTLGAATALLGPRAAMACVRAVEDVIEQHYDAQLAALAERKDEVSAALTPTIAALRDDERAHGDAAAALGGDDPDPPLRALRAITRWGCRAAISVAKRI